MEKENFFKDEKHSFSPMDSYRWIEQGVFGYLQEKPVLNDGEQSKFRDIYYQKFESALYRVEHLITSDPDRGNVFFVLITVATFESFLALGITENKAILLTDDCINKPMYNYLVHGIKKQFDESADPFRTLVQSSKDREENYFGNSFEFERPIDDEYGYVLHIKRCLFHETLKVLDRRELQPILCKMDLVWINGIDPERHGMQFVRPVTFATGNICQFWFIRREKLNKMEPG